MHKFGIILIGFLPLPSPAFLTFFFFYDSYLSFISVHLSARWRLLIFCELFLIWLDGCFACLAPHLAGLLDVLPSCLLPNLPNWNLKHTSIIHVRLWFKKWLWNKVGWKHCVSPPIVFDWLCDLPCDSLLCHHANQDYSTRVREYKMDNGQVEPRTYNRATVR